MHMTIYTLYYSSSYQAEVDVAEESPENFVAQNLPEQLLEGQDKHAIIFA